MTAICAKCHINFANRKDLEASSCGKHDLEGQVEEATKRFRLEMATAKILMPGISEMNYPPAKKAWAKLQRLEAKRHA